MPGDEHGGATAAAGEGAETSDAEVRSRFRIERAAAGAGVKPPVAEVDAQLNEVDVQTNQHKWSSELSARLKESDRVIQRQRIAANLNLHRSVEASGGASAGPVSADLPVGIDSAARVQLAPSEGMQETERQIAAAEQERQQAALGQALEAGATAAERTVAAPEAAGSRPAPAGEPPAARAKAPGAPPEVEEPPAEPEAAPPPAATAPPKKPPAEAEDAAAALAGAEVKAAWWEITVTALGFFWLVVPLFLLAIAQDVYWLFFHAREPKLFPLDAAQKATTVLINMACALIVFSIIVIFAGITWATCQNKLSLSYFAVWLSGNSSICDKLGGGGGQLTGSAVAGMTIGFDAPGKLSTDEATQRATADIAGVSSDACMLQAVVRMESGGRSDAVGCDCAYNGRPELCPDTRTSYSADYRFNWDQCSYGIGPAQVTIYPKGTPPEAYGHWKDAATPSIQPFAGGPYYTVADLLDPDTNLQIASQKLVGAYTLSKAVTPEAKAADAFRTYLGSGAPQSWVDERVRYYQACEAARATSGGLPAPGGEEAP